MKYLVMMIPLLMWLLFPACTDPVTPKINPYGEIRAGWDFMPDSLKTDTLETSTNSSLLAGPIYIRPY
ncbi:MAG: hypothetical protein WAN36_17085, partial [Calditrichia bacterium]